MHIFLNFLWQSQLYASETTFIKCADICEVCLDDADELTSWLSFARVPCEKIIGTLLMEDLLHGLLRLDHVQFFDEACLFYNSPLVPLA